MNLDYGGVESYVVRLSRALKAMGHEVVVLSGGGPMEKLLFDSGIESVGVSLKADNLPNVLAVLLGRSFDIINGHNYNSARVADAISRATQIPYVMTVHGPRPFLKRITYRHWSPQIITISEADARGISGFLGISRCRIHRTFLPIDPNMHSPGEAPESLRREFLPNGGKLILHVSRFTNRKARVALELMKAMPAVREKHPEATLLVAGSGQAFSTVAAYGRMLEQVSPGSVRVEGPRDDVHHLCRLASVVVGTATTAMETLACGTPLIAAGRTGYLGPVDRAGFDAALDVLFGDHGRCPRRTSAALLERDIAAILSDEGGRKSEALALAQRMAEYYNPARAAEQVAAIYETAIQVGGAK